MNKDDFSPKAEEAVVLRTQSEVEDAATVLRLIGKILETNTAAFEKLAASTAMTASRLDELEKQLRLQTPVTDVQVKFLNNAIKHRARILLDKKNIADKKAIMKLSGVIRKAVLARHGISSIREIPRFEYSVDMSFIETWNDVLAVHDIVKSWRREKDNVD